MFNVINTIMPDPVKAPPENVVNKEITDVSFEYGELFEEIPIPFDRLRQQHNKALLDLAYLRAFLKHNEIEVE